MENIILSLFRYWWKIKLFTRLKTSETVNYMFIKELSKYRADHRGGSFNNFLELN